jgi:hypothetical protein
MRSDAGVAKLLRLPRRVHPPHLPAGSSLCDEAEAKRWRAVVLDVFLNLDRRGGGETAVAAFLVLRHEPAAISTPPLLVVGVEGDEVGVQPLSRLLSFLFYSLLF